MPSFDELYQNPGYRFIVIGGNTMRSYWEPETEPEQTTSGELGLQQQLIDDISMDITGFFRDIRNLAGTLNEVEYVYGGSDIYSKYVNSDFGFVKQ